MGSPSTTYQIWPSASPSSLDRNSKSLAFSPVMVVCPSPTADLNSVSNLAWSGAVINERRIFGTVLVFLVGALGFGFAAPVWKEAAISLKPVGCGFTGTGGGARA